MSSIEDIQKVNKMAQEFLDQGVVSSREEAVKKAQEMLNKEIAGNDIQIKETEDRQNIAASGNDDSERLKNMIDRTKEHVDRQFAAYKNALIALEKEIRALKDQVNHLKSRGTASTAKESGFQNNTAAQAAQTSQQQGAEQQNQVQQESAPQQQNNSESHPRTGNSNPEDVSVEKMFYFGNK